MKKASVLFIIAFAMIVNLFGQQFLDEMELIDISNQQDVKSTIIRDPKQALLIVRTQIPTIRFHSNNIIHNAEKVEPGLWHIRLAPGTHRIVFQAEGFISTQKRYYFNPKEVKGEMISVNLAAKKEYDKNSGIIVLKSDPAGLDVYLNGDFYGTTPYQGKLFAGRYQLELKNELYETYQEEIIIIPAELFPINAKLKLISGIISVNSTPLGALVTINGRKKGRTPLDSLDLPIGKYHLTVEFENYHPFDTDFELDMEVIFHDFEIPLIKQEAQISFKGIPYNGFVYVDNFSFGSLPFKPLTLPYGPHSLEISRAGFYSYTKNINIEKNDPLEVNFQLTPKNKLYAALFSTALPGSGQFYSGRKSSYIIGGVAIGAVIMSIYFYNDYLSSKETYITSKSDYKNNIILSEMTNKYYTMLDRYDTMEKSHQYYQIALSITAAFWLYNIVDALLFFPKLDGIRFDAGIGKGRQNVSTNYYF